MALMGAGSNGTQSNGILANILGGVNPSAGGSALNLGLGVPQEVSGSPSLSNIDQRVPHAAVYTEHNVPSRPGYQMVPMSLVQNPLPANATEKHVSEPTVLFICPIFNTTNLRVPSNSL